MGRVVRRLLQTEDNEVYRRLIHEVDRITLHEVLKHVGGNQVHASQRLGISRTTLRAKLANLDQDLDASYFSA